MRNNNTIAHPNGQLIQKTVTSINRLLSTIHDDTKLLYNQKYIEDAYIEYQSQSIDDANAILELSIVLKKEKDVLLLGPGNSLGSDEEKIQRYILEKNPVVISVNFEPSRYDCDYGFVSNAKR